MRNYILWSRHVIKMTQPRILSIKKAPQRGALNAKPETANTAPVLLLVTFEQLLLAGQALKLYTAFFIFFSFLSSARFF